jgi:hypothetical protein
MRSLTALTTLVLLLVSGGCDVVDPTRSTAQPDAEVFGNLLGVERSEDEPDTWTMRVQIGTPRSVRSADEDTGKPTPEVEDGLVATIRVGADAMVVADDRPALLEEIASGTEVVVLPMAGTTRMFGSSDLRLDAATVMDFESYRLWRLPKLGSEDVAAVEDPAMINSSGAEISPVPVAGGRVLYFAAHLRPPTTADEEWIGARREGLASPEAGARAIERSFRTELTDEGWSAPEPVHFPGLEEAQQLRVTWVNADESVCLVSVVMPDEASWIGRAARSGSRAPWSTPERLDDLGADARDGVYLTGSSTKVVFVTNRGSGNQSDLFFFDPKVEGSPAPLEPPIFTSGNEWNPRTGPEGELLFNRGDRQLLFKSRQIRPLRLPGPHRVPLTRCAPTDDGQWIFFCMPKFRTPEMDEDIYVASLSDDYTLGEPVPVDDWRP